MNTIITLEPQNARDLFYNILTKPSRGLKLCKEADGYAGVGTPLGLLMWFLFAIVCWFIMPVYAKMSTASAEIVNDVIVYGRIVCVCSFGSVLQGLSKISAERSISPLHCPPFPIRL